MKKEDREEFKGLVKEVVVDLLIDNNKKFFSEMDKRFIDNNKMLIEAMDLTIKKQIDTAFQAQTARQEIFEHDVRGMLKDLIQSNIQTGELSAQVDDSKNQIKNNIFPRLDILEAKSL